MNPEGDYGYTLEEACAWDGTGSPLGSFGYTIASVCQCSCPVPVLGCTNPAADNYDPDANTDDGSCVLPGCTDATACNYNVDATEDNDTCIYPNSCVLSAGTWTQENAGTSDANIFASGDNWTLTASVWSGTNPNDDGTVTATFTGGTFSADCYEDTMNVQVNATFTQDPVTFAPTSDVDYVIMDDSGVVVYQNQTSFNFDLTTSTASGSLDSHTVFTDGCDTCSGETDGTGTVLDNDADGDGVCDDEEIVGCSDMEACNYVDNATDEGECIYPNACGSCPDNTGSPLETLTCDYSAGSFTLTGFPGIETATVSAEGDNWTLSPATVTSEIADSSGYTAVFENAELASDCYTGTVHMTIQYSTDDAGIIVGDIMFMLTNDLGMSLSSVTTITGVDPVGGNLIGTIDASSIEFPNPDYNPNYGLFDTSCLGCIDPLACNYADDENVTVDDGSCEYPEQYYDCDGNCLNDTDGDLVCDENEVLGCTDPNACNYVDNATDEGECDFETCYGCMDDTACNHNDGCVDQNGNPAACLFDDGSCMTEYASDPVINQISSTILGTIDEYATYQWYQDGISMENEIGSQLLVFESGEYTVEVTDGECSTLSSVAVYYGGDAVGDERQSNVIYPNPSSDVVYLESSKDLGNNYVVEIYDNLGRLVLKTDNNILQLDVLPINIEGLKTSIYNVAVKYDNGNVWNTTLIKQ